MGKGGVYEIVNKVDDRRYIGGAVDIKQRIMKHKSSLRGGYHHCEELQADFDRLGEQYFSFNILEYVDVDPTSRRHWDEQKLRLREQYYLLTVENTYNLRNIRMEPLNDVGSVGWINEMRNIIDMVRSDLNKYQKIA